MRYLKPTDILISLIWELQYYSNIRLINKIYGEISSSINMKAFNDIRRMYINYSPNPGSSKYLDIDNWMKGSISKMIRLKMHKVSKKRILDIGCGAGYFLYANKIMRHTVLGLDLDDDPIYNSLIKLFGIPRIVHRIEKYQKLPNVGDDFDLITAFGICFNQHRKEDEWGADEWKYFICDCIDHLSPSGRIRLLFNYNPEKKCYFSKGIRNVFLNLNVNGVRIYKNQITIQR